VPDLHKHSLASPASGFLLGKTRLAREALAAARADGAATEWVQATRAAASIPLGPFAGLVPVGAHAEDRLHLFQLCAEALRGRAAGKRLVLGVDDAHLLDLTSAALVLHVAMNGTAFVVVTVRAGERCPDSIVALWKDLEVPRLELQQLSEEEVATLLERALGGEVAPGVQRWAYRASEGHPLYLRELVKGALATGTLTNQAGQWRLSAQPALSPALAELISEGLDGLSADELAAARLLALGEPLELDTVARITGLAPLAGLEARGLALVAPAGPGAARLSHTLYGEVVRAAMPHAGAVQLRLRLAEAVRASGLRRPGDALRVAAWLDDAGATPDGPLLLAAAGDANALGDPELAERLARRAPNGPERALVLGRALVLQRRYVEAETVLAAFEGRFGSPEPAVIYLEHRALRVLQVGLNRSGAALALLTRAESWFPQREWRGRVDLVRSQVLLTSPGAGSARAVEALERLLRQDDLLPELRRRASIAYALSLFEVGRTGEARVLTERWRPTALPLRGVDDAYALVAWWAVRLMAGYDWDEVERWLQATDRSTAGSDDPLTVGEVLTMLAYSALRRGKAVTAKRRAREAIDALERSDAMQRLPLAWLCLALSSAMQGDRSDTRAALAGYDAAVGAAPIPYCRPSRSPLGRSSPCWREQRGTRRRCCWTPRAAMRSILSTGLPCCTRRFASARPRRPSPPSLRPWRRSATRHWSRCSRSLPALWPPTMERR
jgi:hypothetical protein